MPDAPFQAVCQLAELPDGEPYGFELAGRLAVLVREGDRVYALGGHCPHTGMRLADGIVEEGRLICFYHGANFDLETGRNIPLSRRGRRFDTSDVVRYAVRIEEGTIYVATQPDLPPVPS